jgi:hypothetical protein
MEDDCWGLFTVCKKVNSLAASIALKKEPRKRMKIPLLIALAVSATAAHAHNRNLLDDRAAMSIRVTTGIGPGAISEKFKRTRTPAADDRQNHLTQ